MSKREYEETYVWVWELNFNLSHMHVRRNIDAFCGRTPKSVLARHYTDYSPELVKRIDKEATATKRLHVLPRGPANQLFINLRFKHKFGF